MTPGGTPEHRVVYLESVRRTIRAWGQTAHAQGFQASYLAALRTMDERLRQDPLGWGDPLYRLPAMQLLVHRGFATLFFVYYAVDQTNFLTYVHDLRPAPGQPLAPGQ